MDGKNPPSFKVDALPKAKEMAKEFGEKAEALGFLTSYLQSLKDIIQNLKTRPLEWGNPQYHTNKSGGIVCHGFLKPLMVYYVVFEVEMVVLITELIPLPGNAFEQ